MATIEMKTTTEVEACDRCGKAAVPCHDVRLESKSDEVGTHVIDVMENPNLCTACLDIVVRSLTKRTRKPSAAETEAGVPTDG